MIASILSGASPAPRYALRAAVVIGLAITVDADFTEAGTLPDSAESAVPATRTPSVADGSGKPWLSWGGLDGNAFLGLGRNMETGSWLGSSSDFAGGRVGLAWGFGSVDARLGVGMFFSGATRGSASSGWIGSGYNPGLDELHLSRPFDIVGWPFSLQAGIFPWKDNPDAAMLGEYLARYRSYPASIRRQGQPWDSLGGLHVRVQGLRFAASTPGGAWKLEALFLADSTYAGPGYDFSAMYTLDARLPRGFEIGAGLENLGFATTQGGLHQPVRASEDKYIVHDTISVWTPVDMTAPSDTAYYEIPADILLSARVALDLRVLFGREPRPDRSGRLFLETAILGWHDLPFHYGNRMDRLIWTAGIYLPSFGWLDVLCLQIERQHLGSLAGYGDNTIPSPVPQGNGDWIPHYAEPRTSSPAKVWNLALLASKDVRSWLAVQFRYLDQSQNRDSYFLLSDRERVRDRTFYARVMMRY